MKRIADTLEQLQLTGNMRRLPDDSTRSGLIDLSSNDYLGIADDAELRAEFFAGLTPDDLRLSSSASRLLAASQRPYEELEAELARLYGRPTLLFNSGYHANTGMIAALGHKNTLYVADKLVHASIIDGMRLGDGRVLRFRHNDYEHMRRLIADHGRDYERVVVIVESVYSMDGDQADLEAVESARALHGDVITYVDEAHAVGVLGPQGLGLSVQQGIMPDILVGTFGKALASEGAFAVMSRQMRDYMVNRCRSLIFSTALSPLAVKWSLTTLRHALTLDGRREHLRQLGTALQRITGCPHAGHIQPLIVGDARRTVELSQQLRQAGYKVLPIRTPTVPPGTERLRFSLSAALANKSISNLPLIP